MSVAYFHSPRSAAATFSNRVCLRRRIFAFPLKLAVALLGWSFLFAAAPASAQPAPVPLLSNQKSAEWIFVYKFNASSFPTTGQLQECRFGGTPDKRKSSQAWAVASNAFPALNPGAGLIGTSLDDPVGATFNEIYNSTLNFITWNDQFYGDPRLKCGVNCTGRWGHSKGILAWDGLGNGLVMQVTTPDWPGAGSSAVPRPREGNTLGCEHATNNVLVGQHFFLLKLSPADTGAVLDALANASVATDPGLPQIARLGGPRELVVKARLLGQKVQSVTYTDVTLSSGVRLISKPSDLWVPPWQLISARLGSVPLRTATWRAGPPIPTTTDKTTIGCWRPSLGKARAVEVATTGRWAGKTIGMSAGSSHAKLGVSLDPAQPFTIFGDMNQQGALSGTGKKCASSQNGRGGLFFVLTDPTLYASMRQLLDGGTAPTKIPRKKKKKPTHP
jgi:hypothetical protein